MRFLSCVAFATIAWAGCGGDDGAPGPDAEPPFVDQSGPLFDPDRVIDVSITIPQADWDALRVQARSVTALFGNCLMAPFEDPFTYFRGDVTIDGHVLPDVGVRKKGFLGSLDAERPSLKLKFDEYVDGQRLLGLKGFTLNNAKQDPSLVRTCLSYRIFTDAGIPASRCNFARVRVNGNDLGVYVHVEGGNKDFLRLHYDDPEGNLYEGTLSDFRDGWTATFELKTNEAANDRTDLDPVIAALEGPDAQLLASLEPVLDVDQFVAFWATEILITHWDGYASNANNFFVYHDPTSDKLQFIPWGADMTFNLDGSPFGGATTTSVQAQSLLARRLYLLPATRDLYVTKLRGLLDNVWDETALIAEVDRMAALIGPQADAASLEQVRDVIRGRRAAIESELAGGPPPWTAPLREAPCFVPIGDLQGTFSTTWGTIGAPDPFAAGTGTMTGTLDGSPLTTTTLIGSTSGYDTNAEPPPPAQVAVIAQHTDGTFYLTVFQIDPAMYGPDRDLPIDWTIVFGVVYHFTPMTGAFELVGLFSDGTVHMDMASTTDGAPVTGTFTGTVIRSPF
jgi:hypothetical protein